MGGRPFSSFTKELIKDREENKCFFCDSKKNLTIAHIFAWKRDNGLPVLENGMCICRKCHNKMDFGMECTREEQIKMLRLCEMYLILTYMKELNPQELTGNNVRQKTKQNGKRRYR